MKEIDERINAYLLEMTVDEKVGMLSRNESSWSYSGCERIGIPAFTCHDGPHGVRDSKGGLSTAFPTTAARGAAFDRDLSYRIAVAEAKEFLAQGWDMRLGNSLDVNRHPLYGRASESAGEDPYLCAEIGVAGIQGTQETGCIANAKHLILNTREDERFRKNNNAVIDERSLVEIYGFPFQEAIQKGNVWSIMTAHSRVNGLHCTDNPYVLKTLLRDYWGFRYFTLNDWSSVSDVLNQEEGTIADVMNAGHDLEANSTNFKENLAADVREGRVSLERLDEAVSRVLRVLLLSGLVDGGKRGNPQDRGHPKHLKLCREGAQKSVILLRNEDEILPLRKSGTIALIGPNAACLPTDARGSGRVVPSYTASPLEAFSKVAPEATLTYTKGCDINSDRTSGFDEALRIAAQAERVVFIGGLDDSQEGESQDRASGSCQLPGMQQELIRQLARVNPDLVVAIISGGVCSFQECIEEIKGLIYAFYPGQEGGNALADVVFGLVNPAGRLPVTMPKSDQQLPPFDDDHRNHITGLGYRWFDATGEVPEFPFGFGLSYTTFEYRDIRLSNRVCTADEDITICVEIKNTGQYDGDEVVQLYIKDVEASVIMAEKQLKGFERVFFKAGETRTVEFQVTAEALSFWDVETKAYKVEGGTFSVMVGSSSDKLPLKADFRIVADYLVPRPDPLPEEFPSFHAEDSGLGVDTSAPIFLMSAQNFNHASSGVLHHKNSPVLKNGDWIKFADIDFGTWLNFVEIKVGANSPGCTLELRLGELDGRVIGSVTAPNTTLETPKTVNIGTSDYGVFGVHDLYVLHRNEKNPNGAFLVESWAIEH